MEKLPLRSEIVDLVCSNLALEWCERPAEALREFNRVLRRGGLLMFTTLGPDTLRELRAVFSTSGSAPAVHPFADMHDIGDLLVSSGFADPVMDMERLTLTYADLSALFADLRASGCQCALASAPSGLAWQDLALAPGATLRGVPAGRASARNVRDRLWARMEARARAARHGGRARHHPVSAQALAGLRECWPRGMLATVDPNPPESADRPRMVRNLVTPADDRGPIGVIYAVRFLALVSRLMLHFSPVGQGETSLSGAVRAVYRWNASTQGNRAASCSSRVATVPLRVSAGILS